MRTWKPRIGSTTSASSTSTMRREGSSRTPPPKEASNLPRPRVAGSFLGTANNACEIWGMRLLLTEATSAFDGGGLGSREEMALCPTRLRCLRCDANFEWTVRRHEADFVFTVRR